MAAYRVCTERRVYRGESIGYIGLSNTKKGRTRGPPLRDRWYCITRGRSKRRPYGIDGIASHVGDRDGRPYGIDDIASLAGDRDGRPYGIKNAVAAISCFAVPV